VLNNQEEEVQAKELQEGSYLQVKRMTTSSKMKKRKKTWLRRSSVCLKI